MPNDATSSDTRTPDRRGGPMATPERKLAPFIKAQRRLQEPLWEFVGEIDQLRDIDDLEELAQLVMSNKPLLAMMRDFFRGDPDFARE